MDELKLFKTQLLIEKLKTKFKKDEKIRTKSPR